MIEARRIGRTAIGLGLAAVACALVAFLRRHHIEDVTGTIEGAYFNRSVGAPAYAGIFSGSVFDPFRPLNAYLWLGGAIAFAISSAVLGAFAIVARRAAPAGGPAPS